jgi:PAS domain S-box-containing protein
MKIRDHTCLDTGISGTSTTGADVKRIMLVDDEAIITMQLEKRLSSMGYEVVGVASSGEESVCMARERMPDLVLMDIVMPGEMDGIEAASQIRSELAIPIIFLTAFADEAHVGRAKQAEPFGYIVKPFHEEEIFASIEVALHRRSYEQRLRSTGALYRSIMLRAFDPILVLDQDRRILDVNDEATRVLSHGGEELVGSMVDVIFDESDRGRAAALLEAALTGRNATTTLHGAAVLTGGGGEVLVDLSASRASYGGTSALLIILKGTPREEKRSGVFRRLLNRDRPALRTGSGSGSPDSGLRPQGERNGAAGNQLQLCTTCKKVKTETGHWMGVESFLRTRYGTDFNHGICSECAHELWPDMPSDLT